MADPFSAFTNSFAQSYTNFGALIQKRRAAEADARQQAIENQRAEEGLQLRREAGQRAEIGLGLQQDANDLARAKFELDRRQSAFDSRQRLVDGLREGQDPAIAEMIFKDEIRAFGGDPSSDSNKELLNLLKKANDETRQGIISVLQTAGNLDPRAYNAFMQQVFTGKMTLTAAMDQIRKVAGKSAVSGAMQTETPERTLLEGGFTDEAGQVAGVRKNIAEATQADADTPLGRALATKGAELIATKAENADLAYTSIQNNQQLLNLIDDKIITGFGANFILGVGNALMQAGLIDQSSRSGEIISNTQAYLGTIGRQTGAIIKLFGAGTGLSDADREYADRIAGGDIDFTEKGIRDLLRISNIINRNAIKNYNSTISRLPDPIKRSLGGVFTPIEIPRQTKKGTLDNPTPADEYLNRNR